MDREEGEDIKNKLKFLNRLYDRYQEDLDEGLVNLDSKFEKFIGYPVLRTNWTEMKPEHRSPYIDIIDEDDELMIKIELPGVEKKNIDLELFPQKLEVEAEYEEEKIGEYMQCERIFSSFYRKIELPEKIDVETSEASFKRGILTVILKKLKGKKIEVD